MHTLTRFILLTIAGFSSVLDEIYPKDIEATVFGRSARIPNLRILQNRTPTHVSHTRLPVEIDSGFSVRCPEDRKTNPDR